MWRINRLLYKLPNRPFAKTAKDNRMARLVDLNLVVDEVNEIFEEIEEAISGHPLKAGDTRGATWQSTLDYGGNNWTQITFATPFADNKYSPHVIATFKDPTILWTVANVLPTGFRIISNNPDVAPNDVVYWGATHTP